MAKFTFLENGRLVAEDARIVFRNFEGNEGRYNRAGDRNFALVIDNPEVCDILTDEGWNVKIRPPREDGDDPFCYLPVSVSYRYERLAPKVWTHTRRANNLLTEETVGNLDYAELAVVDLIINPRHWIDDATGEDKIKAYLMEMHATLVEDYFADKYAEEESPVE